LPKKEIVLPEKCGCGAPLLLYQNCSECLKRPDVCKCRPFLEVAKEVIEENKELLKAIGSERRPMVILSSAAHGEPAKKRRNILDALSKEDEIEAELREAEYQEAKNPF